MISWERAPGTFEKGSVESRGERSRLASSAMSSKTREDAFETCWIPGSCRSAGVGAVPALGILGIGAEPARLLRFRIRACSAGDKSFTFGSTRSMPRKGSIAGTGTGGEGWCVANVSPLDLVLSLRRGFHRCTRCVRILLGENAVTLIYLLGPSGWVRGRELRKFVEIWYQSCTSPNGWRRRECLGWALVWSLVDHRNYCRLQRRKRSDALCGRRWRPRGQTYYRGRACQWRRAHNHKRRVRRRRRCCNCKTRCTSHLYHQVPVVDLCQDVRAGRTLTTHQERRLRSAHLSHEAATPAGVVDVLMDRRVKRHPEGLAEGLAPREDQSGEA